MSLLEARRAATNLIGRHRAELPTPALLLDHDALTRNIVSMAEWAKDHVGVRPHAKVHKSPAVAELQVRAGAVGITTATVFEAAAIVREGIEDVLVANELTDPARAGLLAAEARGARVTVAVDHPVGAGVLSDAAKEAHIEFDVLIEVDVGMTRGGVRGIDEAVQLARDVQGRYGLNLRGVMGWEGHTALELDRSVRAANAASAIAKLLGVADALSADGHTIDVVSAGGTNTYDMTGANPRVTDIQAGTYAVMDTSYAIIAPRFQPVLSILGTVISHHGQRLVLDCGSKVHATTELAPPTVVGKDAVVFELHEEHTLIELGDDVAPLLGDRVELLVSYASGTANLHDFYLVCAGDEVVDVWPIAGRGPGL
jgi:D-threonine aldolase